MPLPPIDGSSPPPLDSGASVSNGSKKPKRKRTRTGRQAEPAASASNLSQHQQTFEPSFIPPIKLRRVDGDQWRVVSASESNTPVTSETEDEDSEDATEIPPKVLSVFPPRHQAVLKKHYNDSNQDTAQAVRRVVQSAQQLLKTLRRRKIRLSYNRANPPFPTLFTKLETLGLIQKSELFSEYFTKATVFFSAVNTAHIKNTGCLSSMLFWNAMIESFAKRSDKEIKAIAAHRFLRQISSMRNKKGLPTTDEVDDFMNMACLKTGWQPGNDEAVQDNPVDKELLVHISSMNNNKGFPKEEKVKAFLSMPCLKMGWQPGRDEAVRNNPIDRDLLMRISSMNSGRGLPKKEQVEAFLSMPCLKVGWRPGLDEAVKNNPVDLKLVICIASMNHCKGFPSGARVKAFITMPCFKVGWRPGLDEAVKDNPIDRKLLKCIAAMNNGKGIPTEAQVKTFMSMPCLRVDWHPGNDEAVKDNPIDRQLLMRIASINGGKGFPTRGQVEAFMTMPYLKMDWQPGRDEIVKDSPIDRERLMVIASMHNCRGFPKKAHVKAFITMPCLKVGWQPGNDEAVKGNPIDWDLIKNIATMHNSRGFPAKKQVQAFISMPCLKEGWQPGQDAAVKDKPVDRKLLAHIAVTYCTKGFPIEADLIAFMQWLPVKNKEHCLRMVWRVFSSSGLPKQKELTANERRIRHCLPDLPEQSIESDDDVSESDHEWQEGDTMNPLPLFRAFLHKWRMSIEHTIKVLALFSSAPPKWCITIAEFEQYLTAFTNAHNERTQVLTALGSLIPILFNHGGAGVRFWLARHNENPQGQDLLTSALSLPSPLCNVKLALTQLPESECLDYIKLCKNLSPAPNKVQWEALKPLREQLDQQFLFTRSRKMMLEMLWPQPEAKRSDYAQKLDSFLDTVPTSNQLCRIHKAFGSQKMQDFLEACIARQTPNTLQVKEQELILEGLLLAHHYLTDHEQIPDFCFSSQVASVDGKGVMINGDALMSGDKRLWYFIAALLIELEQTPEYKFERQQLTMLSGSGTMTLPKPEFSLVGNGFMIKNWSLAQLNAFFEATDFTERWYKHPQDEREAYVVRRDERLAGRARANENWQAVNNRTAPLLPPGVILSLVRSGKPLKPAVWSSLERYANNGQLTARLCEALAPAIQSQAALVPDIVKNAVTTMLAEAGAATLTQLSPAPVINELTFEAAMDALDRFQVLQETELEMLELYRHQMTPMQLAAVIKKMSDRVDVATQLDWHKAYEDKKRDPLGLNEWLFEDDLFDE